jgi:hypothetical protein
VILELAAGLLGVLFLYLVLARLQEVLRSRLSASSVHAAPLLNGPVPSTGNDRAISAAPAWVTAGSNAEPAGSPDSLGRAISTPPQVIVGARDRWGNWQDPAPGDTGDSAWVGVSEQFALDM